ncbi:ABC transporter substrate-binding protein [Lentzea tibetensis]|uniref:ABC transporter substrate-binding protein n=1 Tax=Lentzea tibetensis TaxID=2591470 RepID=A0A563ESS5_9PSEU|nr:ABC transporter substrate-binding protein [Lentzea tibetensis]TWP50729.1 ABC transporter substrate-binding protein [Lentzea tibetensis]
MSRVLCAVAFLVLATAPPAHAIDQSKGHPGYCRDGTGVTVVVDFQQLGGTTIVRCNPQTTRGTGLDALKGAGFQIAGVQRWGEAFICRVENRPSATEELPVKGRDRYREMCVDTPPAAAYWSYWHAGNNCGWEYSQWGVKNRDFSAGGFEGWSFSLNAGADTNPQPRIAPVRPGTEGGGCNAKEEPPPVSNDLNEKQPVQGRQPGEQQRQQTEDTSAPQPGSPTSAALPPPKPRPSASARPSAPNPADNVKFTGGEDAEDVTVAIQRQSGASDYAPWVAGAGVLALGAGAFFVGRRRKRAQES